MTRHLRGMSLKSLSAVSLGTVAFLMVLGTACKRDQPVSTPPTIGAAPPPAEPMAPAANPMVPLPPTPQSGDAITWDLPKGWSEAPGNGMRFATLKPPVPGKIDVSVVMLPGLAGGELGNVNRWRNQIGLPPVDDAGRAHLRQEVASQAGEISLYDFATEGTNRQRMLAGLLFVGGRSWFVKMVGDEAARPDLLKLLKSLHSPAGAKSGKGG